MRLLLDEMYPAALAEALRTARIDAGIAADVGLAGRSDHEVLSIAVANGFAVLTENVADFARISGERLAAGGHHPGVLIALSSRFSHRPAGITALVAAIGAVAGEQLDDRIVYLNRPDDPSMA